MKKDELLIELKKIFDNNQKETNDFFIWMRNTNSSTASNIENHKHYLKLLERDFVIERSIEFIQNSND